jgi:hypothetical protein
MVEIEKWKADGTAADPKSRPKKVSEWTVKDVALWALNIAGVEPRHVFILVQQEVSGQALLNLTEEKLRSDGMPRGPATLIAAEIAKLQPGAWCIIFHCSTPLIPPRRSVYRQGHAGYDRVGAKGGGRLASRVPHAIFSFATRLSM